jgi:hypothetical protein
MLIINRSDVSRTQPGNNLSRVAEARASGLDPRPVEGVGNNRHAKFYSLTRTGQKQLLKEEEEWNTTAAIVTRFLTPAEEK